jgi:hypothetical protein
MRVTANLPQPYIYSPIPPKKEGWHYWQDKASPLVTIRSESPNPWKKPQTIVFGINKGRRRDGVVYNRHLELICYPFDTGCCEAIIIRDRWKGEIFSTAEPSLAFFAINLQQDMNQLLYTVIQKPLFNQSAHEFELHVESLGF